jgi:cell division protein FtsB
MPVELDKIRALLAQTSHENGPWSLHVDEDGFAHVLDVDGEAVIYIGDDGRWEALELDLIAAAPDLHRHAAELADEVERLRLAIAWAEVAAEGSANTIANIVQGANRDCAERDERIAKLRAHNARMAAQINALADACDLAQKADYEEEDAAEPLFEAMVGPKGGDWPEIRDALRRLAAGEVDDV